MKTAAATLFALALAACASTPTETAGDAPGATTPSITNDTCGAGMYKELIGQSIDGPGVPGASRLVRHIRPGTQVTMDYIGQRMNIEANGAGAIQKINCG